MVIDTACHKLNHLQTQWSLCLCPVHDQDWHLIIITLHIQQVDWPQHTAFSGITSSPIPNWIPPRPAAGVTIALCEAKLRGITGWIPHKSDLVGSWLVWPRRTGIPSYCRQEETHIMCDTGRFTRETHFVNETFPFYSKCHFDLLHNLSTGCYNICDAVMACVKIRFRDWKSLNF